MKVLVLGGAGFIGSVLVPYLASHGDDVTVFDMFLYGKHKENTVPHKSIVGDICNINDLVPAIDAADAIVNLAAISNDPASDLSPKLTWEINYKANERIAQLCQASGKRVVYASSCSVYGFAESGIFNEDSKPGPVSLYARTKMLSEEFYLHPLVDSIVLRFATVYGYSAKPRFDLVINTMIGSGYFNGQITVNGGDQWRPVVHVKDVAKAVHLALHAKNPPHRVYNIGSNEQNYQIKNLADIVGSFMPGVNIVHNHATKDGRSYKADFSRFSRDFDFKVTHGIQDAVEEFMAAFRAGEVSNMAEDIYYRVKYLQSHGYGKSFIQRMWMKSSHLKNVIHIF